MTVRRAIVLAAIGAVYSIPVSAQPSGGPCSSEQSDFGPCLEAVEARERKIAVIKAQLPANDPGAEVVDTAKGRVDQALAALKDLSARTASLRQTQEQLAAAQSRLAVAEDPAIRAYERLRVAELKQKAGALTEAFGTVQAGAMRYAVLALNAPLPALGGETVARPSPPPASCSEAIERPAASLNVVECAASAGRRAARVIPGGQIKVPGSAINPPGFSALLSGSDAGSNVSLSLTREIKLRNVSLFEKGAGDDARIQRVTHVGASLGLKAGEGTLFSRDTSIDAFDQLDNRAALTAGLSASFSSSESKASWQSRADALRHAAMAACRADQQSSKPGFVSSCRGQSLTDWVYALDRNGKRINAKIAEMADALYFGGAASVPRFGFGANAEIGRSSYAYTTPALFSATFAGDFADEAFRDAAFSRSSAWVASVSAYAFARLTDADAPFGLSLVPSYTIARTLGYPNTYEKPLFCPATATEGPFATAGCRRFYGAAPVEEQVETWALEARGAFAVWGGLDLVAAPKLSWNDKDKARNHPWLVSVPILAFTDTAKSSAVGVKIDWAFGQEDTNGLAEDDDLVVKLVYQKSFSLTGN